MEERNGWLERVFDSAKEWRAAHALSDIEGQRRPGSPYAAEAEASERIALNSLGLLVDEAAGLESEGAI